MTVDDDPARSLTAGKRVTLSAPLVAVLRTQVAATAERTIAAVIAQVPEYAGALDSRYRAIIEGGTQTALDGFLGLVSDGETDEASLQRALRGAYSLGRSEARAHRSVTALLAAYRVGVGVHWQELSNTVLRHGVSADSVAALAALIVAYNNELSAAIVAGHADEIAARGRVHERKLERLAHALVTGRPPDVLTALAGQAAWSPPATLTVALLPPSSAHALTSLGNPVLVLPADVGQLSHGHDETVVLIPDAHATRRATLRALAGRSAVVGPARPWTQAAASYERAVRALGLPRPADGAPVDTEDHLRWLVLTADPEALRDLRARTLGVLGDVSSNAADRLVQTLRSWLLRQGRRRQVAADLHVHPQTVRYRMNQAQELFGDRLTDPESLLDLMIALEAASQQPVRTPE